MLTANIAALLAMQGMRVGVIDAHLQSPSLHFLFGLHEHLIKSCLNDYVYGHCDIEQIALDITSQVGSTGTGRVFLAPSSPTPRLMAQALHSRHDERLLSDGCHALIETLSLDILLIDTPPGISEETLSWIAVSDRLAMIMRIDQQDYQGTSVVIEIARHLGVQDITLVVNEAPPNLHLAQVEEQLEQIYHCDVGAMLPHCDEIMTSAGMEMFVVRHEDHPFTAALNGFVSQLIQNQLIPH